VTTGGAIAPATPLDEFLEGSGATELGELLETIGLVASLPGVVLAVGLVAFVAFVHRGTKREIRMILRALVVCSALIVVGAVLELAGTVSVLGSGWAEAIVDPSAHGSMLRLVGGSLLLSGVALPGDVDYGVETTRWSPTTRQSLVFVGVVLGALSFAFDGHTVSEGPRLAHALTNVAHVLAGGVWAGGVMALLLVVLSRRANRGARPIGHDVVRFSSVASAALVAAAFAGLGMSLLIIDGPSDYIATDWGRLLLIKTGVVVLAAGVGAYNHFVVSPALTRQPDETLASARVRRTLVVEAVLLVSVTVLTVYLSEASIN